MSKLVLLAAVWAAFATAAPLRTPSTFGGVAAPPPPPSRRALRLPAPPIALSRYIFARIMHDIIERIACGLFVGVNRVMTDSHRIDRSGEGCA